MKKTSKYILLSSFLFCYELLFKENIYNIETNFKCYFFCQMEQLLRIAVPSDTSISAENVERNVTNVSVCGCWKSLQLFFLIIQIVLRYNLARSRISQSSTHKTLRSLWKNLKSNANRRKNIQWVETSTLFMLYIRVVPF